ncbi:uncharacterized protein B0I36DRAFT_310500 [Microdochium trichocladiopsis]|uniref:Nucleic acid-binding protein n=1 Tax=Microdochium trichocladiopsis TaxID=1682393 RepID=A0A9P9BW85_9PEZI|nr:uncharacterized protein B0I36DRAFT_310500 [Microdochium trichocladiopsis]KAH7040350.1 hypothetical protein B0I36DRAFT_310500 [Microdochium trichocladiopsis]
MPSGLVIITGAPEAKDLKWDRDSLLTDFEPPFTRLASFFPLGCHEFSQGAADDARDNEAVWRSIPLRQARLPTGFSQNHNLHHTYRPDANFISTMTVSLADSAYDTSDLQQSQSEFIEQLYENSLVLHDDSRGSQLHTQSFEATGSSLSASQDMGTEDSDHLPGASHPSAAVSGVGHLSDLEDLPKATYLDSIRPQTMTVNLIVGIISIAEPRTVRTRWGSTKSLVEMLLGDETKSGFSVTFWLSNDKRGGGGDHRDSVETTLRGLRRQDVILLRNVALGTFSNKVHGHSLHTNMTRVHLLHRRKVDGADLCGLYTPREMASRRSTHPQLAKARRVWEWTIDFVGGSEHLGKRKTRSRSVRSWEVPPPDTQ